MHYEEIGGHLVPEWLAAYHDYMAFASRVNPWPLQQSPRPKPQPAPEKELLSGVAAQAAIRMRYQPITERQKQ